MVYYKTEEEVERIKESCELVCKTLAYVGSLLKIDITPLELDKKAEEFIRDSGGEPAFKGYNGFPASLCVSINSVVVHGIPSDYRFSSSDIVSVDCGVKLNGYFGDAAYTFAFQEVPADVMRLLRITNESLYKGIDQAVVGNRVGDIGYAIQYHTENIYKFGVVRDLVGHGIGRNLHEEPNVPNYGKRGQGLMLRDGLVIAIEPMINLGTKDVRTLEDKWTIVTKDNKPSAHYEHTVVVRKGKAQILSNHDFIVQEIKNNTEIKEI